MKSIKSASNYLLSYLIVALALTASTLTRADSVAENELKMALAYNFARYTAWPASSDPETVTFCVFDNSELATTFTKLTKRNIGEKKITVLNATLEDDLASCQLLVFGARDRKRIALALDTVKDAPTLTIGELPDFIDNGGIINLYRENGRIRFQINPYAAQRSGLQISARLLQLAKIVGE